MDFDINVFKALDEAVKDTICNIINVNMSKNDVQTRDILSLFKVTFHLVKRVGARGRKSEPVSGRGMMRWFWEKPLMMVVIFGFQKPGCEAVCAVIPALELLLLQLREEVDVLVELSQLARNHGDPHTASVVKSHFLTPRVDRLKLLGDLLTNARRVGCTSDQTGGFGEYILNELQEELTG